MKRILQNALPEELRNIISSELFEEFVGIKESDFAKELYMNYDQIKKMKAEGMHIGLHGYDHYWMNKLNELELQEDIDNALNSLEGIIDKDAWTICYPYGAQNESVIEVIKEKGCIAGLTTEVKKVNLGEYDKYKLPRLDTNDYPPKSENHIKISY